ncbi:hypothetical protein [Saccharicrinis sp. 156]|uniref:hypothetical protein n=1 Tax=Saccharicrinis sp. 156 TaxID=3417574 RepID=UPI003D3468F6
MGILRTVKSDYEIYENSKLECLIAVEREECKKVKSFFKKNKGKKPLPNATVSGFKFIKDAEFDSLKIDFDHPLKFEIRDLVKAK